MYVCTSHWASCGRGISGTRHFYNALMFFACTFVPSVNTICTVCSCRHNGSFGPFDPLVCHALMQSDCAVNKHTDERTRYFGKNNFITAVENYIELSVLP